MKFEYYVLNWDHNKNEAEMFNIFRNINVQEYSEKAIRKYLRSPSKFSVETHSGKTIYGFEALCEEIRSIIQWQEWSRCEYEISVGGIFIDNINEFEKWDCYRQAAPNIEMITREIIYQFKQQRRIENET